MRFAAVQNASFYSVSRHVKNPNVLRPSWAEGENNDSVVWVNFQRKVVERVNHVADAAVHLSGIAFKPIIAELESYSGLNADWDGPGTLPPSSESAAAARKFLVHIAEWATVPDVALSSDGEISIYWRDQTSYVDVSFQRVGRASIYARIAGTIHKVNAASFDELHIPIGVASHLAPL